MLKKALTGITQWDTAVEISGVTKTFTQWQRENTGQGVLKNLFKPQKKIITALDDVSFTVKRGEFVAYAGPNGAGKSTTMKLLAGMLQPTSGSVRVKEMSPDKERIKLMKRLGVLFGNRTELWWDHPVSQSFEWKKVVWAIPDDVYRKNLEMVTELLDIGDLLKTFVRELSLGQRMKADLAMLLLHSPEIILLDEPTLGLDVVAKRQMIDFLKKINRESGVTIIVTSHDMDDLEEMAERIIMIANGKIAYDGGFDGLRNITRNNTKVVVTTDSGISEYEVNLETNPINSLLRQLSEMEGLKDIEIRKAPIEQVIAELYGTWRGNI
ncbi:MAG: ATP-binding cassette domain-containing protein [Oscillospiraceae bacterium]|nr:ATP-binding cassette domain-containing protein [Oscillospiraceae bacterium]